MHITSLNILLPDGRKLDRPHHEWELHQLRWRWLLDSHEGGEAYRTAIYGFDARGLPVHNLVRHKREYPDPRQSVITAGVYLDRARGTDQYAAAGDNDDYQLRLARTPVPTFLEEVVESHLSEIYSREIDRETTVASVTDWWANVDGRGTSVDSFMVDTVAPLLLILGQLDLYCDHPRAPAGEDVATLADEQRLGLSRVVASYILPDNLIWWTLEDDGRYQECLVRELHDEALSSGSQSRDVAQDRISVRYRYWSAEGWWLYDRDGKLIDQSPHPYGRVPIIRVFDRRRPRCCNVGKPRYEGVAELQREFYNRDSELILSDTTQAHPLIQGPEDYVQSDGTMPIGPGWLLPMKKDVNSGTYSGFEIIDFPKDGAESIRANLDRLRDRVDRAALLTKPAGAAGTASATVGQSGISKQLDQKTGNKLLAKIAAVLERMERELVRLVLLVAGNGAIDQAALDATVISYPREFDLVTSRELAQDITEFQAILAVSGELPDTEEDLLCRLVRLMLPGLPDDDYADFDAEITAFLATKAREKALQHEAGYAPDGRSPNQLVSTNGRSNDPAPESADATPTS